MTIKVERTAIRWGVPALLIASCIGAAAVSLHTGKSDIPSLAFGSHIVLAVQIALVFFYGALLLFVPVVRALSDGNLPIELSLKGARWTEELRDVGGDLVIRQEDAVEEVRRLDLRVRKELRALKEALLEVEEAQGGILDQVLDRIVVIEEEVMSRKPQG